MFDSIYGGYQFINGDEFLYNGLSSLDAYKQPVAQFGITRQCTWNKEIDENLSVESVAQRTKGEICFYYGNIFDYFVYFSSITLFLVVVAFIMKYMRKTP